MDPRCMDPRSVFCHCPAVKGIPKVHLFTWADSPLCGPNCLPCPGQLSLPEPVNLLVQVKEQMGSVRNQEAAVDLDAPEERKGREGDKIAFMQHMIRSASMGSPGPCMPPYHA